MVNNIDLTRDSDSDEQQQNHIFSKFFSNIPHRTPSSSVPQKRKSERNSEDAPSRSSAAPVANGLHHPKHNNNNSNNHVSAKPSPFLKQDPTTPSPSPETLEKEKRAVSVVIPSPSQQLKEEIRNAEWTTDDSRLMGLSQRYYPTDVYEKRACKGAYPAAKGRGNKDKPNRRNVSLDIAQPKPILAEKPTVHQQVYRSFMRKLKNIDGPPVTLAPGDEPMLSGFAANFEFVNEYKIREGVSRVPESFNAGCGCKSVCNPARCSCLSKEVDSDDNIIPYQGAPDDPARLVLTPDFLKRTSMIFECSSRCGCKGECWNDVVQRGRTVRLQIFHTGNRGFGLRSPDLIRAGQFIDCYLGEVITKKTADVREDLAASHHGHSYLFGLDFLIDDDDIYVVDGQKFGSPTRFMNHSCNPNCRMFPVSRTHGDNRLYDLAFFSLRDIPPMTELTFDYNPGAVGDDSGGGGHGGHGHGHGNGGGKKIDPSAVKCLCGERNCRGQLWPNQRKGTK